MTAKSLKRIENPYDFTTGSIAKKLLRFMLPILAALILQILYSAVDVFVVGIFGTEAGISAISTGSSIINLIIFVLSGLAMGVTIMMGRYIGERNIGRLNKLIGGAMAVFLVVAAAIAVILLLFAPQLALLMQTPVEAIDSATIYIRICGGGIFFIIGYNLMSSIFRGIGNSVLPLIFVAIACVVNIAGDLLFVGVFHWDVAGAASATVIAQAFSFVLSIVICIKRKEIPISLSWSDISFNNEVKYFVTCGLPMAFQELMTQVSFMLLLAFINGMGSTEAVRLASSSGYGIASKIVAVVMLVPSALMQSMSSFIAQNVGAGKEKRAQKAMGYGMVMGATIGIFMTAAAVFGGQAIAALFTTNTAYQIKAAEFLEGYALEAIVTSVLFSYIGYFNGHGKTFFVMLQGIAQSFIIRVPMAFLMTKFFPDDMVYVGFSAPCATLFGILLNVVYYVWYTRNFNLEELEQ